MTTLFRRLALLAAICATSAFAADDPSLAPGQTLYLPIYSHLYHGDVHPKTGKPSETLVSTHVSIRNTDLKIPIRVTSARYFDTQGRLVKESR